MATLRTEWVIVGVGCAAKWIQMVFWIPFLPVSRYVQKSGHARDRELTA